MHHKLAEGSNTHIAAHKGDTIEIQLDETPTAGYSWEIEKMDSDIIELQSSDYKLYDQAGVGGGGLRTMLFIVKNPGSGNIKLKNAQRWSGDIYKKFEINVNAQ
ncbi:MAG: protease inhibitor I42 family protein [Chitinophagaceae bacterium]